MRSEVLDAFRAIVGKSGLITEPEQLHTYECDGLTNFRVLPAAVLLPSTAEQVQKIVQVCHREKVPFVARGSGTGLSGGALPVKDGIVVSLARMNRILEVDYENARVVVEPGVINADVTLRVSPRGFFYAPDPSSQQVCSIGGNVAENSGGAHCLKYGFTTTHVLGLEVVLPDGSIAHIGGRTFDRPGYDLPGIFVGSEGTLGIATKVILRIVKKQVNLDRMLRSMRSAVKRGLKLSCFIVIGFPDDTPATLRQTLSLIRRMAVLGVYDVAVSKFVPYPGSELFRRLQGEGKIQLDDEFFVSPMDFYTRKAPSYADHVSTRRLYWTMLWMFVNFYVISFAMRPLRMLRTLVKSAATGTEDTRYAKWFVDRFFTRRRWRKLAGQATH